MERLKIMSRKHFIIPAVVLAACSLIYFSSLDNRIMDLFQRFFNSTPESDKVILVNIDDTSIRNIGSWPLSRDCYAESLYVLKNLGARQTVFDLSFVDKSPLKVDEKSIKNSMARVINPDSIFSKSLSFFGNSITNLTMDNSVNLSDDDDAFLSRFVALKNVKSDGDDKTPEFDSMMPCIRSFAEKSIASGFVNTEPDSDGYTRRVHLLFKKGGKYYGQLVFVSFLGLLENPQISVSARCIIVSHLKDGVEKKIIIPRAEDGSVLLKFPKKQYVEYNSISFWDIYRISILEKNIAANVSEMEEAGIFGYTENSPKDLYDVIIYMRDELTNGESPELGLTFKNYFEYRNQFIESLKLVLSSEYENLLLADITDDVELADFIKDIFSATRENLDAFEKSSSELRKIVENSSCIFGTSATSTTDYGLNLYEEHYPNPGVHYTLFNQLLAQDFITNSSSIIGIIYAFILCILMTCISFKLNGTFRQIFLGIVFTIFSTLIPFFIFYFSKIYVSTAIPLFSTFITFMVLTILGFITESKGKRFITNAFGQCLSKEVVKEIVEHPESFKLGGQKLEMTAIFTDIQKFSSFSELLTAGELVALLNYYLTKMSDIIMNEGGTIDKYEGDAIIALIGAPVKMNDHAERAIRAALIMKNSEIVMNEEIRNIAKASKSEIFDDELHSAFKKMVKNEKSIFTRIGINSGEMIAGYMGSENKKNYTMMGNNVNLASRLEGVNKQYSTNGILISEYTKNYLKDDMFLLRKLDKVQVVNVKTPIRLYEPMCLSSDADEDLKSYVLDWNSAIDLFDEGKFLESLDMFYKMVSNKYSNSDKVLKYYIRILSDFFVKGKYPKESDGIGVAYNPELKAFRLLQK